MHRKASVPIAEMVVEWSSDTVVTLTRFAKTNKRPSLSSNRTELSPSQRSEQNSTLQPNLKSLLRSRAINALDAFAELASHDGRFSNSPSNGASHSAFLQN